MANKFLRQYTLIVTTDQGDQYTIKNPITVEFQVSRKNLASLNTATFTVYNLSERARQSIFHDLYDTSFYLPVEFYAGYGSNYTFSPNRFLSLCFRGHVKQAFSYREGCNYKTVIECWDGGTALNNSFVSKTVPAGTQAKTLLQDLAASMLNVVGSVISDAFSNVSQRATTLFGNPVNIAQKLTDNNFYIDNQTAFALKSDEAINGTLNEISEQQGIIESPKRTGTMVEVTTIFEPRYVPSQEVLLKSNSIKTYNGQYKLTGIDHRGIISDSIAGEATTTITLLGENIREIIKTNISNYFGTT